MKNVLKSKFLWASALMLTLGIAGCNIFNPTESVNIKNDDADALTYEGYIKFRNNEYSEAEEYFRKAIEADEGHSEAWLGLMKSVLNRKLNTCQETNVFTLLKYVNTNREGLFEKYNLIISKNYGVIVFKCFDSDLFTDAELMEGYKRLQKLRNPGFFYRIYLF